MNFVKIKNSNDILFYKKEEQEGELEKLEAGIYYLKYASSLFGGYPYFTTFKESEKLIHFKSGIIADSLKKISSFFSKKVEDRFKEMSIVHKLGIIYYGSPGTGKTCTVQLLMKELTEKYNAICLDCTGINSINIVIDVVNRIRKVQDNPIVIFYDEVDFFIEREEEKFLTFLDGNNSFNKLIFIGCTNYVTNISDRIINRKSRIKWCIEIKSLPLDVYKEYILSRVSSLDKDIVNELAFKAEEKGLTIDQLKNCLIDHYIHGDSIEDSIKSSLETIKTEVPL